MNYADVLGAEPGEVVRATTVEEVQAVVARAHKEGRSVLPWGGGTGQDYGYPPRHAEMLLDLSGFDRIVAHEHEDLTVTVQAGVRFAELQAALSARGQYLPLDPPHPERATVGGILATNAFGPSRIGHGTARDWLIGLSVVDAQGKLIRGGGKVVKNVTGYDLPKLHVGALGTLGVIAEATFKVAPRPEAFRTVLVRRGRDTRGATGDFVAEVQAETSPALAYLHTDATGAYVVLGYAGPTEVVEDEARRARGAADARLAGQPGAALTVFEEDLGREAPEAALALRFSCLPADAFAQHEALTEQALETDGQVETLLGGSVTDVFWAEASSTALSAAEAMLETARSQSRSVCVLHAPLTFRRRKGVDLWHPLPPAFPLMHRMKTALDPEGTLNPGRFVGGM